MRDEQLGEVAITAHDRQRRLPAAAQRALVDGLCAHLQGRGRCLDAGIGTGSLALPLVEAGIPLVGVDRSRAMLDVLRTKCGASAPIPLVQGDLTRLPFRDGAFGAALAGNVFHLIAAWRVAVAELIRVVHGDGLLLVNLGSGGQGTVHGVLILAKFREILGGAWPADAESVGPRDVTEFEACVLGLGATALPPVEVRFRRHSTLEEAITRLEHNPFARPSGIDDRALSRAAAATRAWARERFGPLDLPHSSEQVITYRIYRLPPPAAGPREGVLLPTGHLNAAPHRLARR